MNVNGKDATQIYIYKDIIDLQKQLMQQLIQMLPAQNMQTDNSNAVSEIKQTPPPNPEGNISKYA